MAHIPTVVGGRLGYGRALGRYYMPRVCFA
jgi:hypothetical protein